MILATAVGWAVQAWLHVPNAIVVGLLLGMVAAQLVPGGACAVPRREGPRPDAR